MNTVIREISSLLQAIENCKESENNEWEARHRQALDSIAGILPSDSGFDSGSKVSDESTPERVVIETSFHHMDECGSYTYWSTFSVIITASLLYGLSIDLDGLEEGDESDQLADHVHQVFSSYLTSKCSSLEEGQRRWYCLVPDD